MFGRSQEKYMAKQQNTKKVGRTLGKLTNFRLFKNYFKIIHGPQK